MFIRVQAANAAVAQIASGNSLALVEPCEELLAPLAAIRKWGTR